MKRQKPDPAQGQERLQEEALRVANSIQTPGQTKEQTKLIAKGIEKGIAAYKQQQRAKARELDKARKKALRQQRQDADEPADSPEDDIELPPSPARPALWAAGSLFALLALVHLLRYGLGWRVAIADFEIPLSWSLTAAPVAAGLAVWMFVAARD